MDNVSFEEEELNSNQNTGTQTSHVPTKESPSILKKAGIIAENKDKDRFLIAVIVVCVLATVAILLLTLFSNNSKSSSYSATKNIDPRLLKALSAHK